MCHRIHSPVQWVQLSFILMRRNHKAVQMCIPVHLLTVSSTALTNLTLTLTLAHLPFHHAEKKKEAIFSSSLCSPNSKIWLQLMTMGCHDTNVCF